MLPHFQVVENVEVFFERMLESLRLPSRHLEQQLLLRLLDDVLRSREARVEPHLATGVEKPTDEPYLRHLLRKSHSRIL